MSNYSFKTGRCLYPCLERFVEKVYSDSANQKTKIIDWDKPQNGGVASYKPV